MATVTINGTVKLVGPTLKVSEKFTKRELVVTEQGGQFPQHIPVEFTQDRTDLLDPIAPGDQVTVTAFVNGREWTGRDGVTKHFLSLRGDRVEKAGATAPAPMRPSSAPRAGSGVPAPSIADMPPAGDEDDLPF
ncbi:MAG: DUF3127 domain-containing protein [Flavobacteriales bacterium]|nr:DUF3127 domain-containing protein [Flavobacteriales bacterium]MBP9080606.1 DUF3127 domain-containing protein [Flavobacteriales bacterium]